MATTIPAVLTNGAAAAWPQFFGGLTGSWNPVLTVFKVGIGGWQLVNGVQVPRTPDPSLTDLDIIENPSRYNYGVGYTNVYYQKTIGAGYMSFSGPATLIVSCFLDFGEYNSVGDAGSPIIWELGVFCPALTGGGLLMVGYATFPQQTKTSSIQMTNNITMTFKNC